MIDNIILTFDYNGLLEISEILIVSDVFSISNFTKSVFCRGSARTPLRSLYNALQTPSRLRRGGDTPHPLSVFGVELSTGAPALWSA